MTTLPTFFDMVYVNATETSGHGPFTLGTAVTGFQTAAAAGITNGTPVSYRATDGTNWETAHGVIDVSGSTYTLTRGVDTIESSDSNSLVSFGGGVTVIIAELSQDLNTMLSVGAAQSFTSAQKQQGRTNLGIAAICGGLYLANSQPITAGIHQKILFDTSLFTANGVTVSTVNSQLTVGSTGLYLLCGQVFVAFTGTSMQCAIEFYINGVTRATGLNESPSVSANSTVASVLLRLTAGDVSELYTYQNGGSGYAGQAGSIYTFLSVAYLGP
jgi:hypothetical protein